MEQCPVERFSRFELLLFGYDDFVLRDGIVGVILIFRRNRTNPQVIPYHRIDWGKTEMLALLDCRTRIFSLQFLPQLRSRFLQVSLRDIEDPEHLHLRIDIVLFLFVIGASVLINKPALHENQIRCSVKPFLYHTVSRCSPSPGRTLLL